MILLKNDLVPNVIHLNTKNTLPEKRELAHRERTLALLDYEYETLKIVEKSMIKFIRIKEITHISSNSNYSTIFLKGGQSILTSKTLKYWEKSIDSKFFIRCHQSYLVNRFAIRQFHSKNRLISLENNINIPMSRSKRNELLMQF
jgi:two-component system LytT family response regulator